MNNKKNPMSSSIDYYLNDQYLSSLYYRRMYSVHSNDNILYWILIHEINFAWRLFLEGYVQLTK